jgi:hypothetical protein
MRRTVILAAWLLSLAVVAVVAQQPRVVVPDGKPTVIAGNDIGFRVDGYRGKTPVGTLVVRVNGEWLEPRIEPQYGVAPLTSR